MTANPNRQWLMASAAVVSVVIVLGSLMGMLPFDRFEVFGIVTGVWCVILAIRQNVMNFPLGMVNNICFAVLFYKNGLYGIMAVQIVYLLLGAHGWHKWTHKTGLSPLRITRVRRPEALTLTAVAVPLTWLLTIYLRSIGDAAPVGDAIATVMSLSAQFLLNLKRAENWAVGAVVDILYTALYISQGLYLTAGLYAFYLVMCIQGYREWLNIYESHADVPQPSSPDEPAEATATL